MFIIIIVLFTKTIYLFLINVLLLESAKISNLVILNNVNMYKLNLNNIF